MPKARSRKSSTTSATVTPDESELLAPDALDSDEASPGPLRSESWIIPQTRQAQRLVTGDAWKTARLASSA